MYASTSFSSHSARRLLLIDQKPVLFIISPTATSTSSTNNSTRELDANVIMILAILLCAFICSLGLNSIIRCALRNTSINNSSSSPDQLVNQGIKKKALKTFPTVRYDSEDLKLTGLDTECVICISEFKKGEKVRILPKCNHGFHVKCIDKWLRQHSSCPTCRHCLVETCHKIVGSQQNVLPVPQIIVRIHPLEHEALELNYRLG